MHGIAFVPTDRLDILALDEDFAMYHLTWKDIEFNQTYFPQRLGGIFTSPPVAVALGENRLDVFGVGVDYAVYHKVYDATAPLGSQWSSAWENLGGNFTSTPTVVAREESRIDLFGLSADQSMVHRAWTGAGWTAWHELGGGFTSLPVILFSGDGTFDIFARGFDFQIYHANWQPNAVPDWRLVGGGLLGAPTSASAPAAVRVPNGIFLFATADDGTVWTTIFDGRAWKPWNSLGPVRRPKPVPNTVDLKNAADVIFATSEPIATAFFPGTPIIPPWNSGGLSPPAAPFAGSDIDPPQPALLSFARLRVDVFAVGSDGALWHKWMDEKGWHGETEPGENNNPRETGNWLQVITTQLEEGRPVKSSCVCVPSLVGLNRGLTVVEMPPVVIYVVEPTPVGEIHLLQFAQNTWSAWEHGPAFRLPSYYTFAVDYAQIDALRSAHQLGFGTDTDFAAASLSIGKWPLKPGRFDMGDVSTGGWGLSNLSFGPFVVEPCEPVVLTYSIVNSGHSDFRTITDVFLKGAEDYTNDVMKALTTPDPSTIDIGEIVVTDVGGGPTIFGSLLGAGVGALGGDYIVGHLLLTPLINVTFADCDGVVAAEPIGYRKGQDIQMIFINQGASQIYRSFTRHLGSDSNDGCGGNSDYTVFWNITRQ